MIVASSVPPPPPSRGLATELALLWACGRRLRFSSSRSTSWHLAGRKGSLPWRMKTRSQAGPKPLKTVALPPRRRSSPKRKARPEPRGKGELRAPKKPPTAFFYFMEDFRKIYQKENPSVKTMQEVGKACGEKWNTMAFEEKVKYYDIATEKRAEFEKAMAEYNKKKVSGELSYESDEY